MSGRSFELVTRLSAAAGGDVVTIQLLPGDALEYTFIMAKNAMLSYAWTSTGPVYWDLHGERTGASSDDATSIRTGASAAATGSLAAPLAGRIGWGRQNRGDVPVAITLQTRGAYEILGVPS